MNSRYFCVGSWAIMLCLALNTLNAQDVTSRGNFMMGGTLGFYTADSNVKIEAGGAPVDNKGIRSTQFNISPGSVTS